jgi:hypothetical protein
MIGSVVMLDAVTPLVAMALALQEPDPTAVDQVSAGVPIVHVATSPPTGEAPAQLSSKSQSRSSSPQLVGGAPTAAAGQQLAPVEPSAQAPAALSSRSEGRPKPTERIGGSDRCDPQDGSKAGESKCTEIIEKRAAEFKGPQAPELSPEEKLLLEQDELERKSYEAAARRLAITGDDTESPESQGVAFVALRPTKPEEKEKPEEQKPSDAAAAAVLNAILNPKP